MSYEMFKRKAEQNSEFEVIPTKEKLYAEGVCFDENGYMKYDGLTYIPNVTKLASLPKKIQVLFIEKKNEMTVSGQDIGGTGNKPPTAPKTDSTLEKLGKTLFEQLEKIVDPDENTDMPNEIKKANVVCNIADKILTIADLSLKAELLHERQLRKLLKKA
jgi:hypothetical protein